VGDARRSPVKDKTDSDTERARSLSPEKRSPALTPRSYTPSRLGNRSDISASPLGSPRLAPVTLDEHPTKRESSSDLVDAPTEPPTAHHDTSKKDVSHNTVPAKHSNEEALARLEPSPAASAIDTSTKPSLPPKPTSFPARSGTLSWQQRPGSLRGVRSRPISLAAERAPSPLAKPSAPAEDESMSREDISRRLAARDAAFFKQTADRGTSSAAFRRNQVEDSDVVDTSANRMRLHGLSSTAQKDIPSADEPTATLASPSNASSNSTAREPTSVANAAPGRASWASPVPARASQHFSPTTSPETGSSYSTNIASRKSRDEADHPFSPSKGIGNFVQSAMMKRNDSVNKRWSSQTSPTISRANSVASHRDSKRTSHGDSPEAASSRPKVDILGSPESTKREADDDTPASPSSPTKRFSPVKSSWLESALTRPDSPKLSTAPQQPSWMADLSRHKAQSRSVDIPSSTRDAIVSTNPVNARDSATASSVAKPPERKPKPQTLSETTANIPATHKFEAELDAKEKPVTTSSIRMSKPKPVTPPKKDFRSILKPHDTPDDQTKKPELEFRNAAGKLKRTVTGKYVAPDELKDNILKGKAGLQLTDGPQKSPRKDEFKESLLSQKEAMQAKAAEGGPSRSASPEKRATTPEAIRKRRLLASKASAPNLRAKPQVEVTKPPNLDGSHDTPSEVVQQPQPLRNEPVANSKLAERFNPLLANVLLRGPSPIVPSEAPLARAPPPRESGRDATPDSGHTPLQHMTKARAKGPKRRAPKAAIPAEEPVSEQRPPLPRKSSGTVRKTSAPKPRVPSSSRKFLPNADNTLPEVGMAVVEKATTWPVVQQDPVPTQSIRPEAASGGGTVKPMLPSKPPKAASLRSTSGTYSPKPVDEAPHSSDVNGLSVQGAAAKWGRPMITSQNGSTPTAGSGATRSINALSATPAVVASVAKKPVGTPGNTAARAPQLAAKPVGLGLVNNGASGSAIPKSSDASQLFADFFNDPKNATKTLGIDTQSILAANPGESPKLKTLRKQILEIHPDGTTAPLPLYQDHVLFSSSMYLCTHTYGTSTGTRHTEVYFWTGNSVTQAHIESAMSHAKKAAKDISGTFLLLPQEKETPAFLQALGGILVTRKTNLSSSSQAYLLRGRRHFGHLAFDEVDLRPSSLCPGYACILVTADESKIFVWKGAGANPEEIAGARLMAMDLCATADIVEIDSTSEPSAFFAAFPGKVNAADLPTFSSHWQLKRKHDAYRVRLFHVKHSARDTPGQLSTVGAFWRAAAGKVGGDGGTGATETRIEEIVPFCQSDLEADGIYVLDAFFEVYV